MNMEFGHCKGQSQIRLKKNTKLAVVKVLPVYYSLLFDITPGRRIYKGWSNLIHLTATNVRKEKKRGIH